MNFINDTYGIFSFCLTSASFWVFLVGILAFGFLGVALWGWTLFGTLFFWLWGAPLGLWIPFLIIAALLNVPIFRQSIISNAIFKTMIRLNVVPQISETEQVALKAGGVWIEKEFFSGQPDFKKLLAEDYPTELSPEEQAFLDGPVEEACAMVDDYQAWIQKDMPKEVWDFLKQKKFFGMIVPKEYGGLGFSATGHSEVIRKLATRSLPLGISVMVPNSLGPAELLNHYGTEEQKKYYLPRLADGRELPCFALTEPTAGSDAGSITSSGVIFKGEDGKLYIRLNWNKRWITLAAISTVMGMAFRLYDPEHLIGEKEDIGITCALIPSNTPGVQLGRRHDPLGCPFFNCPTNGKDVVVSIDAIIGGTAEAGNGWKMLMESLSAGRGISVPSQSTGGVQFITRVASAHAMVRRQFGVSIGQFEGVAELLAKLTGFSYMMDAARKYTTGGLDKGLKPPVVTAIQKYMSSEVARVSINHGMDILGGAGITMGPRNLLAHGYITTPVAVTVEGANILTRTLMIFGQGALRAHPFALKEFEAISNKDLSAFDKAFWGHMGLVCQNFFRSIVLSLTRGNLAKSPVRGELARYYRKLAWASASFALMTDIAMGTLGGGLKQRGQISGRFADILMWMYMSISSLKRFEAEGRRREDLHIVHWVQRYCFYNIQNAFDGLFQNLRVPFIGWFFQVPIRAWSRINSMGSLPSDPLNVKIARAIQTPGEFRDHITKGVFIPNENEPLGRLEKAFELSYKADSVLKKIRVAMKRKEIKKQKPITKGAAEALKKGLVTQEEVDLVEMAEKIRWEAIQVDSFSLEDYAQPSRVLVSDLDKH